MRDSDTLNELERTVVGLVAQGYNYDQISDQISDQLHVGNPAIARRVKSLEDRFGVTTRAGLLETLRRRNLIPGDGASDGGVPTDQA